MAGAGGVRAAERGGQDQHRQARRVRRLLHDPHPAAHRLQPQPRRPRRRRPQRRRQDSGHRLSRRPPGRPIIPSLILHMIINHLYIFAFASYCYPQKKKYLLLRASFCILYNATIQTTTFVMEEEYIMLSIWGTYQMQTNLFVKTMQTSIWAIRLTSKGRAQDVNPVVQIEVCIVSTERLVCT